MARSLSERLAGLQRSAGRSDAAEVARVAESPLRAAQATRGAVDGDDELAGGRPLGSAAHAGLTRLGFTPFAEFGYWVRVLRYDLLTVHGTRRFVDAIEADWTRLAKAAKVPFVPQNLVFYDTETTGLGTGAGTFPFLHAVGQFEDDEFVLYQYFLTDYGAEGRMLQVLRDQHLSANQLAVVSFNGKSFDWPLLKSRLVMHRERLVQEPGQVDLLHPSRRLWSKTLQRVSLASVEGHVLGVVRNGDLPGKEAPARYFAYLEHANVDLLEPVFHHNATDVCSLVSLAVVIADTLNGKMEIERSSEYVALGRWFREWQEHEQAHHCLAAATTCEDADWTAFWLHSLERKRVGAWEEAVQTWKEMALRYPWTVPPLVELAKYLEHRQRNLGEAQKWTLEALRRTHLVDRVSDVGVQQVTAALRYRLNRIQRKRMTDGEAVRDSPSRPPV